MPSFTTPEPISLILDASAGNIDIIASDRADTVVEVAPADPGKRIDVEAAAKTRVEYADGELRVTVPRQPVLAAKTRTVAITVQLPTASTVRGHVHVGEFTVKGRVGDCEFASEAGNLTVDAADNVDLRTGVGEILVGRAAGSASMEVANGNVRAIEVASGTVRAKVSYGHIDIGVSKESAVQLTTRTQMGQVTNGLDDGLGQHERTRTVAIDAATSYGDIAVHRSSGDTAVVRG
ncbi:DUF4097 family beta strand repeat-containing protein [Stackebrandtia nassauensis]|uniref:DUF4097 domain-containing protein n=1 Tax=Stackebrandtia nassauensis (strain DSM 44728 / CIP 108903 / NRRL B-16338 / NBRC 102104 / LLR-40K-21) TaxID=446470 RepID=D3Q0I5_STANL|nr:DUF4097 family beta strand repeat-containing protein [Stackebrandtia nassauensis]ADD41721.1 hypothetical protein Snas_2026 [Stackebrandtia nassauensis DSM 44728]